MNFNNLTIKDFTIIGLIGVIILYFASDLLRDAKQNIYKFISSPSNRQNTIIFSAKTNHDEIIDNAHISLYKYENNRGQIVQFYTDNNGLYNFKRDTVIKQLFYVVEKNCHFGKGKISLGPKDLITDTINVTLETEPRSYLVINNKTNEDFSVDLLSDADGGVVFHRFELIKAHETTKKEINKITCYAHINQKTNNNLSLSDLITNKVRKVQPISISECETETIDITDAN